MCFSVNQIDNLVKKSSLGPSVFRARALFLEWQCYLEQSYALLIWEALFAAAPYIKWGESFYKVTFLNFNTLPAI